MENNRLPLHARQRGVGEAGEEHLPSAMSVGWTTGQHVLLQKTTDPAQTCMSQKKDSEVQLPSSSQLLGHKGMEPVSSLSV